MLVDSPAPDRQQATLGSVTRDAVLCLATAQPRDRHLEQHVLALDSRQWRIDPGHHVQGLVQNTGRPPVLTQPQVMVSDRPQQSKADPGRGLRREFIELPLRDLQRLATQVRVVNNHPVSECSEHRHHASCRLDWLAGPVDIDQQRRPAPPGSHDRHRDDRQNHTGQPGRIGRARLVLSHRLPRIHRAARKPRVRHGPAIR